MLLNKRFLQQNKTIASILLYFTIFGIIMYIKPNFIFGRLGELREFGVGSKQKTILPVWLVAIFIGILSYFMIMWCTI